MRAFLLPLLAVTGCLYSAPVLGPGIDGSLFRITQFASGLSFPQSMIQLSNETIAVQTSPGFIGGTVLALTDADFNGFADLPGTPLSSIPSGEGPLTQLVQAGSYFIQGNYGAHSIAILDSTMMEVGRFEFDYGMDLWWHDTVGLAVRPTPGQPGSYDLVFNVGSQSNGVSSVGSVGLSNLMDATLNPDSLYMVTLNFSGGTVQAANLRQVASGIRNVFGMGFGANGDLWFTDNAIDGNPFPPQADELNRVARDLLDSLQAGNPGIPNFGFPDCFPDYFTGIHASPGCVEPVLAFTPMLSGSSQGPTQLVFSPPGFPAPFNHGIFIAFAGNPPGQRNPVIFYNFDTGEYIHFLLGNTGALRQTGLLATGNSLFISDFLSGEILQISAVAAPEPSTFWMGAFTLAFLARARVRRTCQRFSTRTAA